MALDWGVSDGQMHGAVALDLCIAPSHRFVWQPKQGEWRILFGLIGRVAAGQRIVSGSVADDVDSAVTTVM